MSLFLLLAMLTSPAEAQEQEDPPPEEQASEEEEEQQPLPPPLNTTFPEALSYGPRDPLVALHEVRFKRARNSARVLFVFAGIETSAGALMMLIGNNNEVRFGTGVPLVAGGLALMTTATFQTNITGRRYAELMARLAEVEGAPDEMFYLMAEEARLDLEREARMQAFATGIYGGIAIVGLGLILAGTSRNLNTMDAGIALTVSATAASIHHGARWRAAVRISADFATLDAGVPTIMPEIHWRF